MKKTQSDKRSNNDDQRDSRRLFLQKSVVASGGLVAAAAIPKDVLASTEEVSEVKPKEEGYRLTEHIANYYKGTCC